jgi:hypothetical protein
MSEQVCTGATLQCTFGSTPSTLQLEPKNRVKGGEGEAANILDNKVGVNISPFGMCSSLSNPQVAAATSAAMGVLTPQPCLPVIPAPWQPGSTTVRIAGQPALTPESTCQCQWLGVISITDRGHRTVKVR